MRVAHRVAVIGSGPAGLYTTELLVQGEAAVGVDIIDRLPTPFGLVRYGVAPDHPRIKSVTSALSAILELPNVRLLGDIEVFSTLTRNELLDHYDAVVYATGATRHRELGIPGEELAGSIPANDMVAWYGGHPDAVTPSGVDERDVIVVGAGNVALDIARMLVRSPDALAATDVPESVLKVLSDTTVRTVTVLCRRGPHETRFSTKELRELNTLDDVVITVDPTALARVPKGDFGRVAAANLALFTQWSLARRDPAQSSIRFMFWTRPVAVNGSDHVSSVNVSAPAPGGGTVTQQLACGLLVSSIGYLNAPLPGLPFDPETGTIPHRAGRVVTDGNAASQEYVCGWVKRGPTGVIGTNRADAQETVETVLGDLRRAPTRETHKDIVDLLAQRGRHAIQIDGWRQIDAAESAAGRPQGRLRSKISTWDELRAAARPKDVNDIDHSRSTHAIRHQ